MWENYICDVFVCYWWIDTHFVLLPVATNQVKLLYQQGQLIAKMHLCHWWWIFGKDILQILISTSFTLIKTLQTGLKDTQYLSVCKFLKHNNNLFYTYRKNETQYTFSHFLFSWTITENIRQAYLKMESMCLGRHVSCQTCKLRDRNGMAGEAPVSRRGHPSAQRQAERQPHGTHLQMTACHWQEIHHTALSPLTWLNSAHCILALKGTASLSN